MIALKQSQNKQAPCEILREKHSCTETCTTKLGPKVPCKCGKVCVGQAGITIETRSGKSTVAEHRFETVCNINFSRTSILDKATGHVDCAVKETIEIRLHPTNFNRRQLHTQSVLVPRDKHAEAIQIHNDLEARPS
jgi:hypothetical protein